MYSYKKYELQLTDNVNRVIVGRHACGRCVNVAMNVGEYKGYRWAGFIDYKTALHEPRTEYVFAACFQGNNAYRQSGEYEWRYVSSGSAFYLTALVYGIIRGDEPWVVHMRNYDDDALPILNPEALKPSKKSNVYRLFG
ncbi:hypothetical protein EYS14_00130 [Alteromonadaceae bacterium M269]|nr:hypothetical protein EYS14_00130 [Alteromonadaceae bacterium M269]